MIFKNLAHLRIIAKCTLLGWTPKLEWCRARNLGMIDYWKHTWYNEIGLKYRHHSKLSNLDNWEGFDLSHSICNLTLIIKLEWQSSRFAVAKWMRQFQIPSNNQICFMKLEVPTFDIHINDHVLSHHSTIMMNMELFEWFRLQCRDWNKFVVKKIWTFAYLNFKGGSDDIFSLYSHFMD